MHEHWTVKNDNIATHWTHMLIRYESMTGLCWESPSQGSGEVMKTLEYARMGCMGTGGFLAKYYWQNLRSSDILLLEIILDIDYRITDDTKRFNHIY